MSAALLAGAPAAAALLAQARQRAGQLPHAPGLVMVRLGDDPASTSYVAGKDRKAQEMGLRSTVYALPDTTSQAEVLALIAALNVDPTVNGILVQLPLPPHLQPDPILNAIHPDKDVDGFHPVNVGRLWSGQPGLAPCTPLGVLALLRHYHPEVPGGLALAGRRAVVVGRSAVVGRPLAGLLLRENATVTVAHRQTADLGAVTREAEFLFVAAGQPWLITPEMVRPGAVVVDVGIHRLDREGRKPQLLGDVHPDVAQVARALTPVPGGVGPMTIAQLMLNTVHAAEVQQSSDHRLSGQLAPA